MRAALSVLVAVHLTAGASAQDREATRDPCTRAGRNVAAFAARAHRWSVRDPSATRRLALGRGAVWVVDENHACCPRVIERQGQTFLQMTGCSVRSESRQALIGVVGARRFALTAVRPSFPERAAGENSIDSPWRADAWSRFVRAAGIVPTNEAEALALATHIHASLFPGMGVMGESRALRAAAGFDVTLVASRRAASSSALDTGPGPGASASEDLRRARLTIGLDGSVVLVELVAARSNVVRVP